MVPHFHRYTYVVRLLIFTGGMIVASGATLWAQQSPGKSPAAQEQATQAVIPVAHRGLLNDAPENTLPNFTACLALHLGFEFDVRRSADGTLVCIHDDTLDRTTNARGLVAAQSIEKLRTLDAGGWFAAEFRGAQIPKIDEVLALIAANSNQQGVYAVDLKADDDRVEADVVALAKQRGVLDRLVFIGRAIDHVEVRERLRHADKACHVAVLAQTRGDLERTLSAAHADWIYVRFVPTATEVAAIRAMGKRTIIAGPTVVGMERDHWQQAVAAGVDAVLTDYPLELRRHLKR